jgi:aminoglycoside 3-N-acetyltransferase
MVIGLSYIIHDFFHHVEEMEGVDYRYMKSFTGPVTDWDGTTSEQTFTMLVRDIDRGVHTEVDPMGALMEQAGIITVRQIGEAKVCLMKANKVYEFTAREMKRKPTLLYTIDK